MNGIIRYLDTGGSKKGPKELFNLMEKTLPWNSLDAVPWDSFPYKPSVTFQAGWREEEIFLRFRVEEESTRALHGDINDPVSNDSCVEFFVNPGDGSYFNFEVNAAGTCYLGHGTGRADSKPVSEAALVQTWSSLGNKLFPESARGPWEILIVIPLEIFKGTSFTAPGGKEFAANFYKCGDALKTPHYLSWNPVTSAEPDFHRPEDFGRIYFEEAEGERIC